jgi:hypothetical protein
MPQKLKSYEDGRKLAAFRTLHPQGGLAALGAALLQALEEIEQPEGYWCSGLTLKPDAGGPLGRWRGGRWHLAVYFEKRQE